MSDPVSYEIDGRVQEQTEKIRQRLNELGRSSLVTVITEVLGDKNQVRMRGPSPSEASGKPAWACKIFSGRLGEDNNYHNIDIHLNGLGEKAYGAKVVPSYGPTNAVCVFHLA